MKESLSIVYPFYLSVPSTMWGYSVQGASGGDSSYYQTPTMPGHWSSTPGLQTCEKNKCQSFKCPSLKYFCKGALMDWDTYYLLRETLPAVGGPKSHVMISFRTPQSSKPHWTKLKANLWPYHVAFLWQTSAAVIDPVCNSRKIC